MGCFIILSAPSSQELGGEKAALRYPGGENPGLLPTAVELGRVQVWHQVLGQMYSPSLASRKYHPRSEQRSPNSRISEAGQKRILVFSLGSWQ